MMDRRHGLHRPVHHWKDQKDTVHIDESWFYLYANIKATFVK